MPSRGEGESGDDDSPRRREETKSRTPRLQPGSAGEHSAAPSAEMSSRGGGESGGHDSPRLQGESSSRNKAKSWTTSLQPGSAGEHGVEPSAAAMEKGSEFAKVDGEAPRPCFAMLGKAPTVVLSSSGKDTLNCRAVAGGLDLDPKKSGIEIQKSKFSKFSVGEVDYMQREDSADIVTRGCALLCAPSFITSTSPPPHILSPTQTPLPPALPSSPRIKGFHQSNGS
uniref:Uncharacterized protein n=1 Tax=Oryza punctata TaxID=4537 RepID=A0A0E0KBY8_ORYPU